MYVICFYWEGERWKEEQHLEGTFTDHLKRIGTVSRDLVSVYVNNLHRGVRRFAHRPLKFVCFTNKDIPNLDKEIEIRNLPLFTKKGVLPRLYMFSRDAGLFGHQVLCLDLDIVIVGSLEKILDYSGQFCARTAYNDRKKQNLKFAPVDGDIMSFRASKKTEELFWKPFIENVQWVENYTQGRERYWMQHIANDWADRWEDEHIAPGRVISYKRHLMRRWRGRLPKKISIVSCHGKPRPHQIQDEWRKKYWPWPETSGVFFKYKGGNVNVDRS